MLDYNIQSVSIMFDSRIFVAGATIFLALMIALSLIPAGKETQADLPFVKNLDYNKFQGLWYEIASKPNAIEKNCKCGQSFDTLKSATYFELQESCMMFGRNITSKSTIVSDAPGLGNFTNHNGPLTAPYWVIDIDYLYRWVVIGQPNRTGYWIQSRTKTMEKDTIDEINNKWASMGFNLSDLEYMDQSCKTADE